MARLLKNFLLMWLVVSATHRAGAFALLGPSPATGGANATLSWQTVALGYNPFNTEIGGPLNLGEEYRWNTRVVTYGFDKSFLDYFGAVGTNAVEKAIAILNNLKPVSQFSTNLTEFPRNTTRENPQAGALELLDLKSVALHLLLEEMGLASPERFVFTLRQRGVDTDGLTNYIVIQRNFDPVTLAPSRFVNGTLYSYQVITNHPGNGFPSYEDAEEVAVVEWPDTPNPAVAGGSGVVGGFSLPLGGFYTGITRDDAGGLRYLYGTNNMNVERPLNDILVAVTNKTSMTNVVTQDLGLLTERSYGTTLTAAQITALYPGILIAQSFSRFTNVTFTNYVGDSVIINNVVTNVFDYTYANVLTNVVSATSQIITQVVEVAPAGFVGPGGSLLVTNLVGTRTTNTTSLLSGEFTIVPTNLLGYQIVADLYTNFTEITNIVVTNATARFTNTSSEVSVQTIDLASFTGVAMSNSPAQLAAAYTAAFPGQPPLLITSTNSYFTNVVTTTITNELITSPYDPVGAAPRYQLLTNYTTNVAQRFSYTFGNVVTNGAFFTGGVFDPLSNKGAYSATGQLLEVLTEWTKNPYSPAITTNLISVVTENPVTSIFPNGSVYVVPTNLFDYNLLSVQLVTVTNLTNNIYSVVLTNGGNRVTNTLNLVRFITNYFLTANPVQFVNPTNTGLLGTGQRQEWVRLVTNTFKVAFPIALQTASTTQPGLRRGVDKITFQRMVPDSIEGPVYIPVTNDFSEVIVTNGANSIQYVRRVSTRPDILFRARDLGLLAGFAGPVAVVRTDTSGWSNNNSIDGDAARAGPGVIPGQTGVASPNQVFIDFNSVTPSYHNRTIDAVNEDTANRYFNWGSFDGSTNAPTVYPVGTSIADLERLITGP